MSIAFKEFENLSIMGEALDDAIISFMKKKKKAYTCREIVVAVFGEATHKLIIRVNGRLISLKAKRKIIHRMPYWAYNFRGGKNG